MYVYMIWCILFEHYDCMLLCECFNICSLSMYTNSYSSDSMWSAVHTNSHMSDSMCSVRQSPTVVIMHSFIALPSYSALGPGSLCMAQWSVWASLSVVELTLNPRFLIPFISLTPAVSLPSLAKSEECVCVYPCLTTVPTEPSPESSISTDGAC